MSSRIFQIRGEPGGLGCGVVVGFWLFGFRAYGSRGWWFLNP